MKVVLEFDDHRHEWTRSELERLAYLHFAKGIEFERLKKLF